jgi:hypothetical protein
VDDILIEDFAPALRAECAMVVNDVLDEIRATILRDALDVALILDLIEQYKIPATEEAHE